MYLFAISHSAAAMKSSKTFCFFSFMPWLVPRLAVLAAAAHVGVGVDEALLEQREPRRAEGRRLDDVEAAVGVEQRRVGAVELQPFLVHEEHRDLRAVLAR